MQIGHLAQTLYWNFIIIKLGVVRIFVTSDFLETQHRILALFCIVIGDMIIISTETLLTASTLQR